MQKPTQKTYLIKSILVDGQMIVTLDILNPQTGAISRSFEMQYCDENMPEDVKKNFKDIANVHSIISQSPETCKVDAEKGIVTLIYSVTFPNGNKFQLQGNLQLKQKQVIPTKQDSVQDSFTKFQQNIKKIQQFCQNDSKQKQQQLQKFTKQILSQVEQIKQRYEEMKHWRKQQEIKYKQLEHAFNNNNKQQQNQGQIGISDAVMHVFDQKLDQHRQIFTQKFQKHAQKVEDLQLANARHIKSIDKLTQQNIQLKKIIKLMQTKNTDHGEKNQVIQSKVVELINSQNKIVNVLNNHNQHIVKLRKTQSSPGKRQVEDDSQPNNLLQFLLKMGQNNKKSQPETKFNPLFQVKSPKNSQKNMNTTFSFPSSNSSPSQPQSQSQSQNNPSPSPPAPSTSIMQIDPKSYYSKQFINTGKLITYNGVSEQPTQLVGSLAISQQRHSFLSVIKSKRNQIGFGVISKAYINERNSIKNPNCIMFHGLKGAIYDAGTIIKAQGMGFKQGDKIKMRVNPVQGYAQWSIDGSVVMKYKSQKLKNNQIQWLPFVRVCDKGDAFKWTLQ